MIVTYIYIHTYTYTYIHVCICVYIYIYIHIQELVETLCQFAASTNATDSEGNTPMCQPTLPILPRPLSRLLCPSFSPASCLFSSFPPFLLCLSSYLRRSVVSFNAISTHNTR